MGDGVISPHWMSKGLHFSQWVSLSFYYFPSTSWAVYLLISYLTLAKIAYISWTFYFRHSPPLRLLIVSFSAVQSLNIVRFRQRLQRPAVLPYRHFLKYWILLRSKSTLKTRSSGLELGLNYVTNDYGPPYILLFLNE